MALMTTAESSASSESRTSSPEHSPEMAPSASTSATSPLSLSAPLTTSQDEHERETDSRRSTPARLSPQDLTRSRPPTRGGCWTCRIRRKKCDEERVEENSCRTCKRLGIKCLGWGTRRPDWMRDKDRVAQYKADIKAQLTKAGLIRGQPRPPFSTPASTSTSTSTPSADRRGPSVASRGGYSQATIAGPRSHRGSPYGSYAIDHSTSFPSRPPSSIMPVHPGLGDPIGMPGNPHDMSLPPFVMHHHQQHYSTTPSNPTPSPGLYGPSLPSSTDFFTTSHTPNLSPYPSPQGFNGLTLPPSVSVSPVNNVTAARMMSPPMIEPTDQLIGYYFEHVRKLQFAYAGQELTQVLYLILQRDPHGPLKHALCALASFHSTKLHMQGLGLVSEDQHTRPLHKHYFDQGHRILEQRRASWGGSGSVSSNNPSTNPIGVSGGVGGHPEDDALSAIFLIAYYSMVSTGQKWLELLEIAYAWFAGCGLVEEQNPKMKLWGMNEVQRVAVKAVMWLDIQSSIIFTLSPRFLPVYRRLLGQGGGGFWSSSSSIPSIPSSLSTTSLSTSLPSSLPSNLSSLSSSTHSHSTLPSIPPHSTLSTTSTDLQMNTLTGCPDSITLTLAESAHLAAWKWAQVRGGCLSVRELVRRGDQVEQSLRVSFNASANFNAGGGSFNAGAGVSLGGAGASFNAGVGSGGMGGMGGMGMGMGRGGSGSGSPVNELVMPTGLPAIDMFSSSVGSGSGFGSVGGGLSSVGGLSGGGLGSGSVSGLGGFEMPPQIDDTARQVIPQIWKETALLYLHTVVNDSLPGTPEITQTTQTLLTLLTTLPPSALDHSILLPLILTSTLSDNPVAYDLIRRRVGLGGMGGSGSGLGAHGSGLGAHGSGIGGDVMAQVGGIVEGLWGRRRSQGVQGGGGVVPWKEWLRERWSSLIMV